MPTHSMKPLSNLENIHLSWNNLGPLNEGSFSSLSHIQKLWIDGNNLLEVPTSTFQSLRKLEALNLASNQIRNIQDSAFHNLKKLVILILENNKIEYVGPYAFDGLVSLTALEINGNHLLELPLALSSLPLLRDLSFAQNKIQVLRKESFRFNPQLTLLEMSGNPITFVDKTTFSNLAHLKKLILSEIRDLDEFPDIQGSSALEHLRIDRAKLNYVPSDLCVNSPLLRSLNLKSNQLTYLPILHGCSQLRLLDLSYNQIMYLEDEAFLHQSNLIDLFLSHNSITSISKKSFAGLSNLQVLDLESNEIENVHPEAFAHFMDLRDLNLGDNKFPKLPTKGLQNLRQIKTFNNRELKEFPTVETFPRINTLALNYAYHCCAFIASSVSRSASPRPGTSLQETIVWLTKDDVDISSWNTNVTDIWPGSSNFSTKFEEFANQLWKAFGRDYTIPDNLAQYAEEYFEDYKSFNSEENHLARFSMQCLPEPGPFMPCEDLFGWWSLRCGVWVVFLLALLGNGIVVVVLILGRSKMDVPRFLVCNLAGADFFMGAYLGMLAVVDASTLGEFKEAKVFTIFVLPLNSCANPFLYAIFTKQFKKDCIHICKRIEESRVTRGIGRGRHSSNFSNRHTPVTTNSAAAAAVGSHSDQQHSRSISQSVNMCNCKDSWKSSGNHYSSWKTWAFRYFMCRGKRSQEDGADGYTYAIAQIQKNLGNRSKHATSISSENFSSRSDSWRQGNIPLRLMDQETQRGSWSLNRKASQDSNISCSRQDSSTSTFHMSRSSFSSDSSNQARSSCSTRPLLGTASSVADRVREQSILHHSFRIERDSKPKLCRQKAVFEENSKSLARRDNMRKIIKEQTSEINETLCPLCTRKELSGTASTFKSKKLEEKFVSFYNRLVANSHVDKSGTLSYKEDKLILSSDWDSADEKHSNVDDGFAQDKDGLNSTLEFSEPHIEVNPMADNKTFNFVLVDQLNNIREQKSTSDQVNLISQTLEKSRCQSLMNINIACINEIAESSTLQNKLSLKSLPAAFESCLGDNDN